MKANAPGIACDNCGLVDWAYNADMQQWDCVQCTRYGKPQPPSPPKVDHLTDADVWTDTTLRNFDLALNELEECLKAPADGEVSAIMRTGKKKRAEKKLEIATAKAEVADFILTLKRLSPHCDMYLEMPNIDLKMRVTW